MSENLTIALIGPGAIGTTIAAALHEVDRAPLLCGRTAHAQLTLRHDEGEIVVPGPVLTEPAAIQQPVDLLFVAVKTTQVAESAGWLAALCDETRWCARCKTVWSRKRSSRRWSMARRCCLPWSGFRRSASRMPLSGCGRNRA